MALRWRSGSLLAALERLGRALPTGVFSSAPLESHLQAHVRRAWAQR
jgi:hypothetical protein